MAAFFPLETAPQDSEAAQSNTMIPLYPHPLHPPQRPPWAGEEQPPPPATTAQGPRKPQEAAAVLPSLAAARTRGISPFWRNMLYTGPNSFWDELVASQSKGSARAFPPLGQSSGLPPSEPPAAARPMPTGPAERVVLADRTREIANTAAPGGAAAPSWASIVQAPGGGGTRMPQKLPTAAAGPAHGDKAQQPQKLPIAAAVPAPGGKTEQPQKFQPTAAVPLPSGKTQQAAAALPMPGGKARMPQKLPVATAMPAPSDKARKPQKSLMAATVSAPGGKTGKLQDVLVTSDSGSQRPASVAAAVPVARQNENSDPAAPARGKKTQKPTLSAAPVQQLRIADKFQEVGSLWGPSRTVPAAAPASIERDRKVQRMPEAAAVAPASATVEAQSGVASKLSFIGCSCQ